MAIILLGQTPCAICGSVLTEENAVVSFPAFVFNEADPLRGFNDAGVHAVCFEKHPLKVDVSERVSEFLERNKPEARVCVVCDRLVEDYREHFAIPHLTDDSAQTIKIFNYNHFHRRCMPYWANLQKFQMLLVDFKRVGDWKGDLLERLASELAELSQQGE